MNISRKNHSIRSNQKGATLIELSLYIAVAAALLFGLFILLGRIQASRITSEEARNLTMMASDLRTKFSNQSSFAGLSNANAIRLNAVPSNMVNGSNITTKFGTTLTIAAAQVNGTNNDGFSFTLDVPSKSCSDLIAATEGSFSRISIAGTVVKDTSSGDNELSVTDQAACNATATGNANTTLVLAQGR